uniref:Uncharacterized protein n=1 Tax=Gossypium raimondii TaxID=29730 RepID=A0A0D2NX64_GOSRA|nr:hypothetical protein B456_003G064400 [Gossypium raimondii]KJB18643.1 hypothetical protein B456_003G064400 [Gossypium raimondii]
MALFYRFKKLLWSLAMVGLTSIGTSSIQSNGLVRLYPRVARACAASFVFRGVKSNDKLMKLNLFLWISLIMLSIIDLSTKSDLSFLMTVRASPSTTKS